MDNLDPPRWRYILAVLIFIAGQAAFIHLVISDLGGLTDSLETVVVPGSANLTFSEPGQYTIFYEYRSAVGGRIYSSDKTPPNLECRLLEKETGSEISLHPASVRTEYLIGGRSGCCLFDFEIIRPGIYELSAMYPEGQDGKEIVLAAGTDAAGDIIGIVVTGLAVSLGSMLLALWIGLDTYRKRKKALEQAEKEKSIVSGRSGI